MYIFSHPLFFLLNMYVYMYVCVYVCMYVYMHLQKCVLGTSLSPTSRSLFKSTFTFIWSVSQVYIVSFFQTCTLAKLFCTCQMFWSAWTAEPLLLVWEECLRNLVPSEARSQVCTAHCAGVAGRILAVEMLWTSSSTVFVGVLITPLPVMKKKNLFCCCCWLSCLQEPF